MSRPLPPIVHGPITTTSTEVQLTAIAQGAD